MADEKLSQLPTGTAIVDADLSYWDQSASSVSQPASAISTYANSKLPVGSAAQKGIVEVDNTTITASSGVISAVQQTLPTGANPTGTAGPAAVNGTATTFMRSDGAPAVQKASASVFGIVEVDNTTITAAAGVISSVATSPGGSTTQLQRNNAGAFGGISGVTSNGTSITVASGDLLLAGSSTGSTILNAAATASGTITVPAATDTLTGKATTDTLTNKTITSSTNSLGGVTAAFGSDAKGDIYTNSGTSNVIARLAVGTTHQFIGNSSGLPAWAQPAFTDISGRATSAQVPTDVAYLDVADQTVSGGANVTVASLTTGNVTIDCGTCPLQKITNGGAFTITAPANDGSCMVLITNNASAGAVAFSGFSVGANTGDAITTTNTSKFTVSIWRINSISGYRIAAMQ